MKYIKLGAVYKLMDDDGSCHLTTPDVAVCYDAISGIAFSHGKPERVSDIYGRVDETNKGIRVFYVKSKQWDIDALNRLITEPAYAKVFHQNFIANTQQNTIRKTQESADHQQWIASNGVVIEQNSGEIIAKDVSEENATFIANSKNTMPLLIQAVDMLEATNEAGDKRPVVRDLIAKIRSSFHTQYETTQIPKF